MIGKRLGRYRITEQIGAGGMGVDFLVMEYDHGQTLDTTLASGKLGEAEIVRLGTPLAQGLAAARARGIVHRDLKPGNLRLTADGTLKILDFGRARLHRSTHDTRATMTWTATATADSKSGMPALAGTLPCMSPEQLRGEALDARSELFAAGVVLSGMATGRRRFAQQQAAPLVTAILNDAPPPLRTLNPHISPAIESSALRTFEKDPGCRHQSAPDLCHDLARAGTDCGWRRRPSFKRRLLLAAVLLGVLVLVICSLAGWLGTWMRNHNRGPTVVSLAVLPLAALSGDPEPQYFSDGLTDELIAQMARIDASRVVSRTPVVQYKNTQESLPQIGQKLRGDRTLEGSVQRTAEGARARPADPRPYRCTRLGRRL